MDKILRFEWHRRLRQLRFVLTILTFGIRSIRSPAKVGIGYYKAVNYWPDS